MKLKHGCSRRGRTLSEYRSWTDAIYRCTNPAARAWDRYGGRGITVCQRYRESFLAFYADLGDRPAGATLDRIDNESGYFCGSPMCQDCGPICRPRNVRWATRRVQNRNRRTCRLATIDGRTMTVAEWLDVVNLPASTVYSRLAMGWTPERALSTPARRVVGARGRDE